MEKCPSADIITRSLFYIRLSCCLEGLPVAALEQKEQKRIIRMKAEMKSAEFLIEMFLSA